MARNYCTCVSAFLLCLAFCSRVQATTIQLHRTTLPQRTSSQRSVYTSQSDSSAIYKCFKYVRGNHSFASNDYYDTVVGCLNSLVANNLKQLNGEKYAKLKIFGGVVELERTTNNVSNSVVNERTPKGFVNDATDPETVLENNVADGLNNLTRNFAVKVRLFDGVKLRLSRGMADAVSIGIVVEDVVGDEGDEEDDDDNDLEDDDDDEEEEEDYEEEIGRQARAGGGIVPSGGGGGGGGGGKPQSGGAGVGNKKKKKKKTNAKKKDKEFKEKLPMLLIPFVIQAILLPLFLANLKLIALKSIIVGKITLFLVAYNYLRRMSNRKREDNELEHIAVNHYGFNGDMEYGALVNRRSL